MPEWSPHDWEKCDFFYELLSRSLFYSFSNCYLFEKLQMSGGHTNRRPEDVNDPFINQASWEEHPVHTRGTTRASESRYGAI